MLSLLADLPQLPARASEDVANRLGVGCQATRYTSSALALTPGTRLGRRLAIRLAEKAQADVNRLLPMSK